MATVGCRVEWSGIGGCLSRHFVPRESPDLLAVSDVSGLGR
jgi:hypothetical protein